MKNQSIPESVCTVLPQRLKEKLMTFQKEGIEYAVNKNGRVLIADEMGLGKTIQAISVAYYYKEEWPLLIIVPSSLRYCWIEELEKWLPDIHPHDINLIMMGNDVKNISSAKISVITYGLLSKSTSNIVKEALTNQKFQVVICDESHYIRNSKTASSKAVVPLVQAAQRRILLSGTPALSKPVELYPQLDAICPKVFGSWWDFTARYCDAKMEWIGRMKRRNVKGASNLEELQTKLTKTVMIRREKKDVLKQLPPKQRQKVLFELKDSALKSDIKSTFNDLKPKLSDGPPGLSDLVPSEPTPHEDVSDANEDKTALGLISKLLQLTGEAKVGPVKDYINMLIENENLKFLIFAYHHVMMNGIQQLLYEKKVKFIRIDGTVPPSDRQLYVTQFQSDPSVKVAILSILAAGVGLTLTAAKLVVFAEMYWTPGVMVQCEDRAHRIGQTSSIPVHYLVAKGTMDEWVWSAVCKKTLVTSTALNGKKEELEAEKGDHYQVELLSNAEVNYAPKDNSNDMDVTQYFASQRSNDQKSILDFFTPPTNKGRNQQYSESSASGHKRKRDYFDELEISDSKKPQNINKDIVILDSDSESEDFHPSKKLKTRTKLFDLLCRDEYSSPSTTATQRPNSFSPEVKALKNNSSKLPNLDQCHWSCSKCTFLNHQRLPYCEMCDAPKPLTSKVEHLISVDKSRKTKQSVSSVDKSTSSDLNQSFQGILESDNGVKRSKSNGKQEIDLVQEEIVRNKSGDLNTSITNDTSSENMSVTNSDSSFCDIDACDTKSENNVVPCDTDDVDLPSIFLPKRRNAEKIADTLNNDMNSMFDDTNDSFENYILTSQSECTNNNFDTSKCLPATPSSESKRSMFGVEPSKDTQHQDTEHQSSPKTPKDTKYQNSAHQSGTRKSLFRNRRNSFNDKFLTLSTDSDTTLSTDAGTSLSTVVNSTLLTVSGTSQIDSDSVLPNKLKTDCETTTISCSPTLISSQKSSADDQTVPTTIYSVFYYGCSKYTGRVYIFNEKEESLHINFLPLDIEVGNIDDLLELLQYQPHLRLVQKFTREWNMLTDTKKRLLINRSAIFKNPVDAYRQISSKHTTSTQRHKTKEDISIAAAMLASTINGSVRQISKYSEHDRDKVTDQQGVAQVVDSNGVPLCLNCQTPYNNTLLTTQTITSTDNAWKTRFCSLTCADTHWTKTDSGYCRDKIYQIEHGICQLCHVDAHSLYKQIKDTVDIKERARLISESHYSKLKSKIKGIMTRKPVEGQFWHVDHIKPVWEGGGMCDIDNMRTLCVLCHHKVTAQQATKRTQVRRLAGAASSADITAFFQKS